MANKKGFVRALVTPAILTSFSSRADKSLGFRGVTPELSSVEKAAFMDMQGINVRLLIEPTDYPNDGKREVKSALEEKTPSSRLRAVLFCWHEQLTKAGKLDKSWEMFYKEQMERMIEDVKSNLEPES